MTEERRNIVDGRRLGKERRGSREYAQGSSYTGAERRAGDRRDGVSRRSALVP